VEFLAVILLWIVVPTALVGAGTFVLFRKLNSPRIISAIAAMILTPIVMGAALSIVDECSTSSYIERELKTKLTPEEAKSLVPERAICSTAYTFERRGKPAMAFGMSGIFRTKIFIVDDQNQP
jgi:hypothetical protein